MTPRSSRSIIGAYRPILEPLVTTEAGRALREQALSVPPAVIKQPGLPLERLVVLRHELVAAIEALDNSE